MPTIEAATPIPAPPQDRRELAVGHRDEPVPSVAAVAGHPLHPMVVPLPIGAFSLALVSDLALAATGDAFWERASRMLLSAGIVTGLAAGALGAMDFTGREATRRHGIAWAHAGGNLAVIGLSALNLALRSDRRPSSVLPTGLALSLLGGTILAATGWLGGEMSYRHLIGVPRPD